jgi:hypothetical protein
MRADFKHCIYIYILYVLLILRQFNLNLTKIQLHFLLSFIKNGLNFRVFLSCPHKSSVRELCSLDIDFNAREPWITAILMLPILLY